MKKTLLSCICAIVCSFPATIFAFTFDKQDFIQNINSLEPYLGIDAQMRHSSFQNQFGGNIFAKNYPTGNISLGVRISDCVGIEAGHTVSVTKNKVTSLRGGEAAVGRPVDHAPAIHRGTSKFKVWHMEVIGYTPLYKKDCLSLITSVGLNRATIFAVDKLIQNNYGVAPPTAFAHNVGVRTFHKKRTFLTAGIGLQLAIDDNTFCRAKLGWEHSSRFKSIASHERTDAILKPKNSLIYSLGVVFNFC